MISFDKLLHAKIQQVFGVDAVLIVDEEEPLAIRCVDRTAGIEIEEGAGIKTVRPAADLRRSELNELGFTLADLDGATLAMNGQTWEIKACLETQSPFGTSDGIVTVILVEA